MVWLEEDEVCEEDEEVEELEEMGAEEPHSSLQRGHVCRSESGNVAICSVTETQAEVYNRRGSEGEIFIRGHIGPLCCVENKVVFEVDS